jgi:hypothetical protein
LLLDFEIAVMDVVLMIPMRELVVQRIGGSIDMLRQRRRETLRVGRK